VAVASRQRSHAPTADTHAARRYNSAMQEARIMASGIVVQEKQLSAHEQGFVTGVFEAFANRTLTEEEFRALIAQVTEAQE
jgi:hypothetical protein